MRSPSVRTTAPRGIFATLARITRSSLQIRNGFFPRRNSLVADRNWSFFLVFVFVFECFFRERGFHRNINVVALFWSNFGQCHGFIRASAHSATATVGQSSPHLPATISSVPLLSHGPGVCCVPPAAQATGSDCRSHGGVCAPIAGCNFAHGNFAPPSCGSYPGVICCVPQSICGEEKLACCTDQTTFRPACDRGTFECNIAGTTLKPRDQCP